MVQYHHRDLMDDAGDEYTLLGWTRRVGYGKPLRKYDKGREVFSACAGAALYRKSILIEIGLFDEKFFAYLEDVDLSYRARIHGYQCVYCPGAVVYHVGSATSGGRYNQFKIPLSARNNVYLPYKNMPWPQLLLNLIFLVMGFFMKYLFFLRQGYGKLYLQGIKDGLDSLNEIDGVEFKRKHWKNYFKIEWLLIKNTLLFIFF
jgi:GT2 family glycosyltransferase